MLKNIPSFIKSIAAKNRRTLLQEFRQSPLYIPKRRLPFLASMIDIPNICDAICVFTAYKLVIKKFPMHTLYLLNKILKTGTDSLKTLKMLYDRGNILCYLVFMVDEMYIQKTTQYQAEEYAGVDEKGNTELQYSWLLDSSKKFYLLFKRYLRFYLPVNDFQENLQRSVRTLLDLVFAFVHLMWTIILQTYTHYQVFLLLFFTY